MKPLKKPQTPSVQPSEPQSTKPRTSPPESMEKTLPPASMEKTLPPASWALHPESMQRIFSLEFLPRLLPPQLSQRVRFPREHLSFSLDLGVQGNEIDGAHWQPFCLTLH